MSKLKTIVLDIETSPILAYVWGTKEQDISLNQVVEDSRILAWSAKELGKPKNTIVYRDLRKTPKGSDSAIVRELVEDFLSKSDIVVTYNGKRFDVPKVNARAIINKIYPDYHFKHFDVWELVSRTAAFTSTKFEYVSQLINKAYKKLKHEKFPGMELWSECLLGNTSAWNEMKLYNLQDTLATEESALILKEWAPKSFPDWDGEKCDNCGKIRKTKVKCLDCSSWSMK